VKPSYGLNDAAVERMLLDALDHGEEDLQRRRLAENRVDGGRILGAATKALRVDKDLLHVGEEARIEQACAALEESLEGDDPRRIQACIEALDDATKAFAGRRMNRAIARAIGGRKMDVVEKAVEHAKGVDEAHAR
jgi:molecular chaperone HscA